MKYVFSRLWDYSPSTLLGKRCPHWLEILEESIAMKFPESWFDQAD